MKKLVLLLFLFAAFFTQAQVKPSQLPAATTITKSDIFIGNQGGVTKKFILPVVYPNQSNYVGTVFYGDGGDSLSNVGTEAGDFSTYVGYGSGFSSTISKKNTALGWHTLYKNNSGWANTAVGYNVLASGRGTGSLTISGTGIEFYANTAIGEGSMQNTTTGSYNVAAGNNSLNNNTVGSFNTALGVHALNDNISGKYNIAVGHSANRGNLTGDRNVSIGYGSLLVATALSDQIAIGNNAQAANLTGSNNVAIGSNSLVTNTNGASHVAIGYQSLYASNYDAGCTAIGFQAGYGNAVNSNYNTYVGFVAGKLITTGAINNTFIGGEAGNGGAQVATVDNTTAIGYGANTTASNQVVIGNASVTDSYFGSVSGASSVHAAKYYVSALNTAPSSATDTGTAGEIRISATAIYVCTATNTWVKTALATW